MLRRSFVLLVKLELLNDAGVFDESQQDFLRDVSRFEGLHLWPRREQRHCFALISIHITHSKPAGGSILSYVQVELLESTSTEERQDSDL